MPSLTAEISLMGRSSGPNRRNTTNTVRIGRRDWPVLERMSIGRSVYLILDDLGSAGRHRYMAFDPHAGPDGDLRAILDLPRSRSTEQHLRVLKRISANNFNLPTIHNYRANHDRILVVTEWIRGPTLASFLNDVRSNKRPRPSPVEALRLVRGLAHGLSRLHRKRQIIHGDVKPANLILASDPSRLVLIDFGSAWQAERTFARDEGDGLNSAYAPPELQTGQQFVDFRTDQFSAAVILYELLTLQRPYDQLGGKAGRPEFAERMAGKLIPPSTLSPNRKQLPRSIWDGIDRITMTGLAFDPDDRYATPDAWLADLNAVQADIHQTTRLSPTNARMTRVIGWIADRFRRR